MHSRDLLPRGCFLPGMCNKVFPFVRQGKGKHLALGPHTCQSAGASDHPGLDIQHLARASTLSYQQKQNCSSDLCISVREADLPWNLLHPRQACWAAMRGIAGVRVIVRGLISIVARQYS